MKNTQDDLANQVFVVQADPDNIFQWRGVIFGPSDSPYEGGYFRFRIDIPTQYPFKAPTVQFETRIYHPNFSRTGNICLNILKDEWTPAYTIGKMLQAIVALLTAPNPDDPLDGTIGRVCRQDPALYNTNAREWTRMYAIMTPEVAKMIGGQPTTEMIETASSQGQLSILEWCRDQCSSQQNFEPFNQVKTAIDQASANGHISVLDFWRTMHSHYCLPLVYSSRTLIEAERNGHHNVVEWWMNSGLELKFS